MRLSFKNWLDENTFVGGGAIRGAGQVTGEGPGAEDGVLQYLNANMQDADTRDNQLRKFVQSYHTQFHNNSDTNKDKTKKK